MKRSFFFDQLPGALGAAVLLLCSLAPAAAGSGQYPETHIDKLYATLSRIVAAPEMKDQLLASGVEPMLSPSLEAYGAFLASELARWGKVVKQAGIKSE